MPFRLRGPDPVHPLEPLAAQGQQLIQLLLLRNEEKRRQAAEERAEARHEKAMEAAELAQATQLAGAEREGFRVGRVPTTGGGLPTAEEVLPQGPLFPREESATDRIREGLERRIGGPQPEVDIFRGATRVGPRTQPAPAAVPEPFAESALPTPEMTLRPPGRGPIEFGGQLQARFDPMLAIEMAEMSPEEVFFQREQEAERNRNAQLARALEGMRGVPEIVPELARAGNLPASVLAEVIRERTVGRRGGFDPQENRIDALRQALLIIRQRIGDPGERFGETVTIGQAVEEAAREFGLDPDEIRREFQSWLRTGALTTGEPVGAPPPGTEATPEAPAVPQGLSEEEVAGAREVVQGMDPATARGALREAGYSDEEIAQILGG